MTVCHHHRCKWQHWPLVTSLTSVKNRKLIQKYLRVFLKIKKRTITRDKGKIDSRKGFPQKLVTWPHEVIHIEYAWVLLPHEVIHIQYAWVLLHLFLSHTGNKIRFMYSQKCTASFPISTLNYLWAIYIFTRYVKSSQSNLSVSWTHVMYRFSFTSSFVTQNIYCTLPLTAEPLQNQILTSAVVKARDGVLDTLGCLEVARSAVVSVAGVRGGAPVI